MDPDKNVNFSYKPDYLDTDGEVLTSQQNQDALLTGGLTFKLNAQRGQIKNIKNAPVIKQLKCAESINTGDAVALADGASTIGDQHTSSSLWVNLRTDVAGAQSFDTTSSALFIEKVSLYLQSPGATEVTSTIVVEIRTNNSGEPSDTVVASVSDTKVLPAAGAANYDFTFSSLVSVDPSTTYHIVAYISSSGTGNDVDWGRDNTGSTGAHQSSGGISPYEPTGTWSAIGGPFRFATYEVQNVAGEVYQADASNTDFRFNNFIGFSVGFGVPGDVLKVYINGAVPIDGLSAGSLYYLSDTAGQISTSAGTNSLKVGKANSIGELIIINT